MQRRRGERRDGWIHSERKDWNRRKTNEICSRRGREFKRERERERERLSQGERGFDRESERERERESLR